MKMTIIWALLTIVITIIVIVLLSYGGHPGLAMLALIVGIIILAYILLNPIIKRVNDTASQNQESVAQINPVETIIVESITATPTCTPTPLPPPECYISWDATGQIPADLWGNHLDEDKQPCPEEIPPGEFKGRLRIRLYCVCGTGP